MIAGHLRLVRRAGSSLIPNLASAAAAPMVSFINVFFLSEPAVAAEISRAIAERVGQAGPSGFGASLF
jgi:hypothetical protein